MKFFSTFIFFSILSQLSFGQEHSSLFQPEVMKKNRVLKVLEYHPEDSLTFFKKYPKGFYSKYDKEGRTIESNHYSHIYQKEGDWLTESFINYYIYDSSGKQIAFISKFEEGDQPFRYINLTLPGKTLDSVDIVSLKDQYNPTFRFTSESTHKKESFFRDTIEIGKRHKRLISIEDSSMYMDLYFNKKGAIDSSIFYTTHYSYSHGHTFINSGKSVTCYFYFKDGGIEKITEREYGSEDGILQMETGVTYFFLENGLLERMAHEIYSGAQKPDVYITKFSYTFRKE
ncbi:MAG: hypothetical protein ACO1N0_14725 [Fluviicola sp.]